MKRSKKCQLQPEVISGSRAQFESHFLDSFFLVAVVKPSLSTIFVTFPPTNKQTLDFRQS